MVISLLFSERNIFKVFFMYGHGGHRGHMTWTIWTNFRSLIPRRLHMKFGFSPSSSYWGKEVWKYWIWVTWTKGLNFLPYKSIRDQIWPCCKIGQGQPRVIIWTNFVVLEYPMLHTKFKVIGLWFQRRRFLKVFTIYSHGGHLGNMSWTVWINFRSPIRRRLLMKLGFSWPSGFRGEDVWKCWQHTYIWTTEVSSPMSRMLRWANKIKMKKYTRHPLHYKRTCPVYKDKKVH